MTFTGSVSREVTVADSSEVDAEGRAHSRSGRKVLGGLALAVVGVAVWVTFHVRGAGFEATDDAQVEGHIANVSSRIVGRVRAVKVRDNQVVNAGDVLVELEPEELDTRVELNAAEVAAAQAQVHYAEAQLALAERDVAAALSQAKTGVAQAHSGLNASASSRAAAAAELRAAMARQDLTESEYNRAINLYRTGATSRAELDARQGALDAARASAERASAQVRNAEANALGSRDGVDFARSRLDIAAAGGLQVDAARALLELARAKARQADANKRLAEQNREHVKIRAPIRGVVSRRSVEVGQVVSPDRPLLALVALDDVWIVANFKESQVEHMKTGQTARVSVDGFKERELVGRVESIAAAAGSRFSLLPPDNATGNFVKVVQRIPVLIRLADAPEHLLRPGMNATANVSVRR